MDLQGLSEAYLEIYQQLDEAKVDDRLNADQKATIRNRRLSPGDRLPVRGETSRDTEERLTQTRRRRTARNRGAQGVRGSQGPKYKKHAEFGGITYKNDFYPEKVSARRDELRAKRTKNNIRSFKEGKTFEEFMIEEVDTYDIILSHLLDEGYAETLEEAQDIYLNLDEASMRRLAWNATKSGAKAVVKAIRDYGSNYPIGSKRRAVADTIDKLHWASLSDAERRRRTNAQHRARNTKKGHEEIMARNRKSQEVSDKWHEQQRKKQERRREQTGKYRGAGVGSRESVRENFDVYDIVLSHLLDEGYAETLQQAEVIMVNMSEDWKDSIVEEFVDPEKGEAPSGRSPLQNVSDHPKASVRRKAVKAFRKQMGKEYGGTWRSRSNDPTKD